MKKLFCVIILLVASVCFFAAISSASSNISMFVDGVQVYSDVPPQVINDRTMVPIRFIAEALKANVDYNEESSSVIITSSVATEKYQFNQWSKRYIVTVNELSDIQKKIGNETNVFSSISNYRAQSSIYESFINYSMNVHPPEDRAIFFYKTMETATLDKTSVDLMVRALEEQNMHNNPGAAIVLIDEASKLLNKSTQIRSEILK